MRIYIDEICKELEKSNKENNPKKVFDLVKTISHNKSKSSEVTMEMEWNGLLILDEIWAAEIFRTMQAMGLRFGALQAAILLPGAFLRVLYDQEGCFGYLNRAIATVLTKPVMDRAIHFQWGRSVLVKGFRGAKKAKVSYRKIFFMRCVRSGGTFCLITKTLEETKRLMKECIVGRPGWLLKPKSYQRYVGSTLVGIIAYCSDGTRCFCKL